MGFIRRATPSDAVAVQAIMNAIPWIAEKARTEEGCGGSGFLDSRIS
jgi:hypothetical protein